MNLDLGGLKTDALVYLVGATAAIGAGIESLANVPVLGMSPLMGGALLGAAAGAVAFYTVNPMTLAGLSPALYVAAVASVGGLVADGLGYNPLVGVVVLVGAGMLMGVLTGNKD